MEENKKNKIPNVPNLRFNYEGGYTEVFIGDLIIQKGKRAKGRELDYKAYSINNQTGFSVQEEQWGDASYTKLEKKGYKVIENNDLAYNPARINVGSVGLYKEQTPCIVSSLYVCFATKPKLIPDYLFKYLKSEKFNKKVLSTQEGGVRTYFFYDKLQKTKMFIPTLSEQKKVNDFLNCINERIDTQNKIIENYESLIKPITEKLVKRFKCNQYRLKDISQIKKGQQIGNKLLSCGGAYPMLNGGISFSGNYVHFNRRKETIAISEGGNSCGYVSFIEKEFWAGGHCYTIHPKRNDPDFNYCLYSILKVQEKKIMALRVGSGLPNIQKKDLEKLLINFPVPAYVSKFNAVLRSINAKVKIEKEILSKLVLLKQYLLANMFI